MILGDLFRRPGVKCLSPFPCSRKLGYYLVNNVLDYKKYIVGFKVGFGVRTPGGAPWNCSKQSLSPRSSLVN